MPVPNVQVRVVVGGQTSNAINLTYAAPIFDAVTPEPDAGGGLITVSGDNFGGCDPSDAASVVDQLALLLTAGRLNQHNRRQIEQAFLEQIAGAADSADGADSAAALRVAQVRILNRVRTDTDTQNYRTAYQRW